MWIPYQMQQCSIIWSIWAPSYFYKKHTKKVPVIYSQFENNLRYFKNFKSSIFFCFFVPNMIWLFRKFQKAPNFQNYSKGFSPECIVWFQQQYIYPTYFVFELSKNQVQKVQMNFSHRHFYFGTCGNEMEAFVNFLANDK